MNPIIFTSGNQTVQFTNADITVNGTVYPYSGITRIWNIPQRSAYAILCRGETVALRYEEKDAAVMRAIFERIAQALGLTVEGYQPEQRLEGSAPEPVPGEGRKELRQQPPGREDTLPEEPSLGKDLQALRKQTAGSDKRDRRFLIELGAGILLIVVGVVGFILS